MDKTIDAEPHLRQPKGLATLFMTEMWERFSFYGMKAQLTIFLIASLADGGQAWTNERAATLMAWYGGLVYLAPMIGGYLADRFLGTHRCLVIGGILIASGHFVLLIDSLSTLYVGLGLVIAGTGFFKSNVSTMVGQMYRPGDPRRDAGFTIFYMGINLGAFFAPLLCAWVQTYFGHKFGAMIGWRLGFGLAGVGMVAGLIVYLLRRDKTLSGIGDPPAKRAAGGDVVYTPLTSQEIGRIVAIFVIAFFVVFFFSSFEQSSTSMAIFAQQRTDRTWPTSLAWMVGGVNANGKAEIPAGTFQSINPLLILLLSIPFARFWMLLAENKKEPSTPTKMGIGLILVGIGFVFMVCAGKISDGGGAPGPWWIIATLFIHTCGELCLSPVGLSLVTKLAPLKFASMLMGVWFLAAFAGNFIAGMLASKVDAFAAAKGIFGGWGGYYLMFVIGPIVMGLILVMMKSWVNRLMDEGHGTIVVPGKTAQ